ncbi:hypothetical protein F5148DRAFT_973375 [Russula earlei]|uniref:Uncharacterized protein n=1 Tax=Russula earlei TaxID=71964 RepID=A0ACC0ULM8_9AGAM|nr:hypothetical protein F5148DRAFT_973375 [Russula earlei]
MADFVQGLDASKLIFVETVLSFTISPFNSPAYNLPIFLFGLYVQESQEVAPRSLQAFSGFLGASVIFDIIWFTENGQSVLGRLVSILILVLKVPTFLAFAGTLRTRGVAGISISGADFGSTTVWAMPGGFTSSGREGYQTVESDIQRPAADHPVAGIPPSAPGAYQTV